MQISIVIVSYNATAFLDQCLISCKKALDGIDGEIIVVDNNSPEKAVQSLKPLFPNVLFVENKENLGFAKANNLGVSLAKGKYVLILNPDTILPENIFKKLIPFYESQSKIGAVGVKLIDANGNFHPESKRNLPNVWNSFAKLFPFIKFNPKNNYYNLALQEHETGKTTVLVGAFMFLNRKIYIESKGFDERYFMYGEDIDLSYTIERLGYENYYFGETTVIHYKGESTKVDKKYYKIFFEAMNLFIDKYYQNFFTKAYLKLGIWIKYQLEIFKSKENKTVKTSTKKDELNFIHQTNSEHFIQHNQNIVFNTKQQSFEEIIHSIEKFNSPNKTFFIESDRYIIGDSEVFVK